MKNTSAWAGRARARTAARSLLSSAAAIAAGFLAGFIILSVAYPDSSLAGLMTLVFGGTSAIGVILYQSTPIILTGLSVGFAYKTGLFNIGTPGQFIIGAFVSVYVSITFTAVPSQARWAVALLCGGACGAVWGMIPGLLKAYRNVNEVISGIMLNYIAMYTVNHLITVSSIYDSTRAISKPPDSYLPFLGMDRLFPGSGANAGTFMALMCALVCWVVITRTSFGYSLRACGFNADAGRYAGINDKRCIVSAMMIAGALAAFGGGMYYLSHTGKYLSVVDTLAREGFNGIPVALLAMCHPIGIFFCGVFIAYLNYGGYLIQLHGITPEIVEVVIAAIIFCSASAQAVRMLAAGRRSKRKASAGGAGSETI